MELKFNNNLLHFKDKRFNLKHNIKDVIFQDDLAIVIFELDEFFKNNSISNCQAFDVLNKGELVWVSELPNQEPDYFVSFFNDNRLWSWTCFKTELDFSNGKNKK